jgi:hypothetical protein
MSDNAKAQQHEELTDLFVERANDGDASPLRRWYEPAPNGSR